MGRGRRTLPPPASWRKVRWRVSAWCAWLRKPLSIGGLPVQSRQMVRAHRQGRLATAFPPRAARGKNGRVSDAGEFIDLSLQREASWRRAEQLQARLETEPAGSGPPLSGTAIRSLPCTV